MFIKGASYYGVSFSPAGLLTPFHLGASYQLREIGIINSRCSLAGASGGSLAAIASACEPTVTHSHDRFLKGSFKVAEYCRTHGTRGSLRFALDQVLREILPDDIHRQLSDREGKCIVAYTEIDGFSSKSIYATEFESKEDVIECLRASCNIPFYFDGFKPTVTVRGKQAIDGFFATDLRRFGSPYTGANGIEILVTPFRSKFARINPYLSKGYDKNISYAVISPDLLDKLQWPFRHQEVLRMALTIPLSRKNSNNPITSDEIEEIYSLLFDAGKTAVTVWNAQK